MASKHLQILITCGHEDPDRMLLGLNTGVVAASSGVQVTVFFTLRGTVWACAQQASSTVADEVGSLLDALTEAGAKLECCSACLDKHCVEAARQAHNGLRRGVRPSGLASMVMRALDSDATLTF